MDNDRPIIKYSLMQHYFIQKDTIYESLLVELLNHSAFTQKYGHFTYIPKQPSSEPDAVSDNKYEVDFKLLISGEMAEFRNLTQPIIQELAPGVKAISSPRLKDKDETVITLFNALRSMNEEKLYAARQNTDDVSNAITHFFDKVISKKKNIILFIPLYLDAVDEELTIKEKEKAIAREIYEQNKFIYDFRRKHFNGYDTYLIYVEKFSFSWKEAVFVIAEFSENNLSIIDRVPFFSIDEVKKLYDYYENY